MPKICLVLWTVAYSVIVRYTVQSATYRRLQEPGAKADRKSAKKPAEKARKGLQMFSHLLPFDAGSADALIARHG